MASEMLSLLAWANVTLGAGILIVLALRVPVRRLAGARVAYALWLLPLLAFLAWLAPARRITLMLPQTSSTMAGVPEATLSASDTPALVMVAAWIIGIAAMMTIFALRQRLFVRSAGSLEPIAEHGHSVFCAAPSHGPAVVGALRPIILLPRDFNTRFSAEERALVIAHERTHLDRLDPLVNAAAMGLRAVNWFNPLVHVASHALRLDQELACDASVLARHANSERTYAEAMLKSHTTAFHVPVGCAWHTPAFHSLKERILMLKSSPTQLGRGLGLSLVVIAAITACGAVWLLRPVEVLAAPAPQEPASVADAEDVLEVPEAVETADEADDINDADLETLDPLDEARQEALLALKDAHVAMATARREAARESVMAMKAARAAIADARLAVLHAQPAIAAARRDAARAARHAEIDARKAAARASAMARLATACKHALERTPSPSLSTEEELRALEKLVCIPGLSGLPASNSQPQD